MGLFNNILKKYKTFQMNVRDKKISINLDAGFKDLDKLIKKIESVDPELIIKQGKAKEVYETISKLILSTESGIYSENIKCFYSNAEENYQNKHINEEKWKQIYPLIEKYKTLVNSGKYLSEAEYENFIDDLEKFSDEYPKWFDDGIRVVDFYKNIIEKGMHFSEIKIKMGLFKGRIQQYAKRLNLEEKLLIETNFAVIPFQVTFTGFFNAEVKAHPFITLFLMLAGIGSLIIHLWGSIIYLAFWVLSKVYFKSYFKEKIIAKFKHHPIIGYSLVFLAVIQPAFGIIYLVAFILYSFSVEKEQKRKNYIIEGIDFFITELLHKTKDKKLAEAVKQASVQKIDELMNKTDKEIETVLNEVAENEKTRLKFETEQRAKGLELYQGNWLHLTEIKKIKEAEIGLQNNFAGYSHFEFEEFIAKLFRAMEYNTEVTSKTGDYGIDVIARKGTETIAIQVKHYMEGNNVGNQEVQRLLGSMKLKNVKATHGILVTTSRFTVQAKVQAEETDAELWDRNILHQMVRKYLIDKTLKTKTEHSQTLKPKT